MIVKKILVLALAALVVTVGAKQYEQHKMTEEIADKIIRFHILANSDSDRKSVV